MKSTPSQLNAQVGGSHYQNMNLPHVTFCEVYRIGWCASCVLKYVMRFKNKNGFQDLEKAHHYLLLMYEHRYMDLAPDWSASGFKPSDTGPFGIDGFESCPFVLQNGFTFDQAAAMDYIVFADNPNRPGSDFAHALQNAQLAIIDLMLENYPAEAGEFCIQNWGDVPIRGWKSEGTESYDGCADRCDCHEPDDPVPDDDAPAPSGFQMS